MVLLWSGNYIIAKVALREFPPLLLLVFRSLFSGLLMLPFLVKELRKRTTRFTTRDILIYTVIGIFGVFGNQCFFVLGISRTNVTHSSVIIATGPIWVLLFTWLMGMEKITRIKLAGLSLSITGVIILQLFRAAPSANGPTLAGDAGILMAALLFAAMTAFSKRYNPGASSIIVNSIGYIGGAILFLPVGAWYWGRTDFHQFSAAAWGGVFYMAAFSSVACYLIYYWVLERISASRIAAFSYLQPFCATLMAVYALGEQLTVPAIVSGLAILAGVVLTERFE